MMTPTERTKEWRKKNPEKYRKSLAAYKDRHREKINAYAREYAKTYKRNQKRRHARDLVKQAVSKGELIKPNKCEFWFDGGCGGQIDGHHDNYDKPLEVWWLCKKHHVMQHHPLYA